MSIKRVLSSLLKEIVQEADASPDFKARLEIALGLEEKKSIKSDTITNDLISPQPKRPTNRRTPAVLDPVQLARRGEKHLREELAKLNIEQLRDVVADYGMDTGKLVLKWRDPERIIDRIVEVARGRAQKGSAFRDQPGSDELLDRTTPAGTTDGGAQSEKT